LGRQIYIFKVGQDDTWERLFRIARWLCACYQLHIYPDERSLTIHFPEVSNMKIFLHGLEGSSKGAKATCLRDFSADMVIPDFKGNLSERMASLRSILAGQKNIILIGSSFGGLMATIFAMESKDALTRIVLLAPALNFPEFLNYPIQQVDIPTWLIIGRDDTVTPAEKVVPTARKIFTTLHYEEVADDHLLGMTFRKLDWKALLAE
jgi:pimeloyl-ACP methyl ester carboxylesterase